MRIAAGLKRNEGFALVYTLWIAVILSVLLGTLGMSVRSGIKSVQYEKDALQSQIAVRSGLYRVAAEVTPKTFLGLTDDLSSMDEAKTGWFLVKAEDWSVEKLKAEDEKDAQKHLKEGFVLCFVAAEDGRFPMNKLGNAKGLKLSGMDPLAMQGLSEYLIRQSKNGEYSFTEMIEKGVLSYKAYEGEEKQPGLKDIVTSMSEDGKMNVNAAPAGALQLLTGGEMPSAEKLVKTLKDLPVTRPEEFKHIAGMTTDKFKAVLPLIKVKSDLYRIKGTALINGIASEAEGVFNVKTGMPAAKFITGG